MVVKMLYMPGLFHLLNFVSFILKFTKPIISKNILVVASKTSQALAWVTKQIKKEI